MARKISLLVLGFVFILALLAVPVSASAPQQIFYYTPTPGADGRIMYVIQPGDTCISISLLNNVPLNDLRLLNNLDTDCFLVPGNQLLLGLAATTVPDSGPTATPTPILPSPTPFAGTGTICVYLYNDINGNALIESGEGPVPGGVINITGKKSFKEGTTTDASIPQCFDQLPEDEYTVSVAAPQGYNPTTNTDYTLKLRAGDQSTLDFGTQVGSQALPTPIGGGDPTTGRSPILGILGGVVILAGLAAGIYALRIKK